MRLDPLRDPAAFLFAGPQSQQQSPLSEHISLPSFSVIRLVAFMASAAVFLILQPMRFLTAIATPAAPITASAQTAIVYTGWNVG